jgi:hypothetical protein
MAYGEKTLQKTEHSSAFKRGVFQSGSSVNQIHGLNEVQMLRIEIR